MARCVGAPRVGSTQRKLSMRREVASDSDHLFCYSVPGAQTCTTQQRHAAVSFCRHIHGTPACLPAGVVVVVGVEEGSLWPKVRVWARARTRTQTLPQPRLRLRRRRRAPEQAAPTRGRRWLTCPPRSPCQLAADAAAAAGAAAAAAALAIVRGTPSLWLG